MLNNLKTTYLNTQSCQCCFFPKLNHKRKERKGILLQISFSSLEIPLVRAPGSAIHAGPAVPNAAPLFCMHRWSSETDSGEVTWDNGMRNTYGFPYFPWDSLHSNQSSSECVFCMNDNRDNFLGVNTYLWIK